MKVTFDFRFIRFDDIFTMILHCGFFFFFLYGSVSVDISLRCLTVIEFHLNT